MSEKKIKRSWTDRFLTVIEKGGNALPHPATLFGILALLAIIVSGICAWAGHFYAIRAVEVLGLVAQGGVTRMGISAYTTDAEIDYTLQVLREIINWLKKTRE